MSPESQWDAQTALKTVLDAAPALTGLLAAGPNSIYDHVPATAAFPYVVIGQAQSRPWDTQEDTGLEQDITIQVYSRHRGYRETKLIMQALYDALHRQEFAVNNQIAISCLFTLGEVFLEADGLTRRGVQNYTVLTEPS